MARTVKVNLDVDERPYVRGVQRAENATERLDDAVDDLGGSAKTTTVGMGRAGDAIDDAGDSARDTARDFDKLSDELRETERRVKSLAEEIRRVGPDADLLEKFGAERSKLAQLERVRVVLRGIGDDAADTSSRIGVGPGGLFASVSASGIGALAMPALAAGGPFALGLGAFVGAGLAGAIGGTVGAGAIAAGIGAAADDPRVVRAWEVLVSDLTKIWDDLGATFAQPTEQAIVTLRRAISDVRHDIDAIGRVTAPLLDPLARGVGGFVREAVPGIRDLALNLAPVFEVLRQELPVVGRAMRQFFESIGDGAEGGADALRLLLRIASLAIIATGEMLEAAAKAFHVFSDVTKVLSQPGSIIEVLNLVPQSTAGVGTAFAKAARRALDLGDAVRDLTEEFNDWIGLSLSAEEAADRFAELLLGVNDAVKENGRALEGNTQGAIDNRQMIRELIDAANDHRQAEIDRAGATEESVARANAAYDSEIQKVIDVGVKAGLSREELVKLAGRYQVDVFFRMQGLSRIRDQLKALARVAAAIPGFGPGAAAFNLAAGVIGFALSQAKGGIVAAQHGLITDSPTILFGERETGKEAFIPMRGITRDRALDLGSEAMRWHRASVVPNEALRFTGAASQVTQRVVHEHRVVIEGSGVLQGLRREIRVSGGNVQSVLGP